MLLILVLSVFAPVLAMGGTLYPVVGSASFTGGIYGTWDFAFTSGPVGVYLQQIDIDLSPTGLKFDTVPGGFGSLTSLDIDNYLGTDVGTGLYQIVPGTGAVLDGGQLLTFRFNDFTAGETFHFTGDVDNPDPTLTALRNCSGLGLLARLVCAAQNLATTAQNDARLLAAALVTGEEFGGTLVTFTFGGPGFSTGQFTGAFEPDGGLRVLSDVNGVEGEVEAIPEPATFVSLGAGMLLLGGLLRRRAH
ncbi:MAG: PEP-CTERM sorting domain-containing protein [Bryobacteraceae bacterium]